MFIAHKDLLQEKFNLGEFASRIMGFPMLREFLEMRVEATLMNEVVWHYLMTRVDVWNICTIQRMDLFQGPTWEAKAGRDKASIQSRRHAVVPRNRAQAFH